MCQKISRKKRYCLRHFVFGQLWLVFISAPCFSSKITFVLKILFWISNSIACFFIVCRVKQSLFLLLFLSVLSSNPQRLNRNNPQRLNRNKTPKKPKLAMSTISMHRTEILRFRHDGLRNNKKFQRVTASWTMWVSNNSCFLFCF